MDIKQDTTRLHAALTSQATPPTQRAALVGAIIIAADAAGVEAARSLSYTPFLTSLYREASASRAPEAAAALALVGELLMQT